MVANSSPLTALPELSSRIRSNVKNILCGPIAPTSLSILGARIATPAWTRQTYGLPASVPAQKGVRFHNIDHILEGFTAKAMRDFSKVTLSASASRNRVLN